MTTRHTEGHDLPPIDAVARIPVAELPAWIARLAALQSAAAVRLQSGVSPDGDDVEAFDAAETARRLGVSTDTVREHGEAWGIARVLTRDRAGRPTRVVYPRALVRAFLLDNLPAKRRAA